MRKFSALFSKAILVVIAGIFISACSSTMEGVGKDLQNMGTSMGGSSSTTQNNQSQTKGKDVVVTPVK